MSYVPDRGDVVWANFNPQAGHEQAGMRPALILSRKATNEASGLAVCCPITGRSKGYPFEVALPQHETVYGVVLVDQVTAIDWKVREASFIAKASEFTLRAVKESLDILLS